MSASAAAHGMFGSGGFTIRETFIHELTHVWQGFNFGPWYMLNSLFCQAFMLGFAYDYQPGRDWDDYNAEQQACIVEDWFQNGMSVADPRFPYVQNKIRAPHSHWKGPGAAQVRTSRWQ